MSSSRHSPKNELDIFRDSDCTAFSFGIIGDTQYVDADDGTTFDGNTVRRYRQSLRSLKEACTSFKDSGVICCILLGDIVDAKCSHLGIAEQCLREVLGIVKDSNLVWHYCIGNHDLMCFTRKELHQKLIPRMVQNCSESSQLHYELCPYQGYRFIFLDGYEISTIGASSEHNTQKAEKLLQSKNANLAIQGAGWFEGLPPMDQRYVPYNGALSGEQLAWFDSVLQLSSEMGERCFVFSHMPCYRLCCRPSGLMWSSEEVLHIMHKRPGTVAAFFAGHDHDGGYAMDSMGIHHIVPPSPLECGIDEPAHGHVTVHNASQTSQSFFELHWTGKIPDQMSASMWPSKMYFFTEQK